MDEKDSTRKKKLALPKPGEEESRWFPTPFAKLATSPRAQAASVWRDRCGLVSVWALGSLVY